MPLSEAALGALLNARTAYIEEPDYAVTDFQNVIGSHTTDGSAERIAWLAHIQPLTKAMGESFTDETVKLPDVSILTKFRPPKKKTLIRSSSAASWYTSLRYPA